MSYTVERPDRPAAEVAAAHDDAPSRTLLGSASTFTARLLESAKARAELLQSQAQVTMAAASERIRGKSDTTLAPEADQAEISAGGQEAGAAQSAPHKSASALASTVMAAAADLSRKTREGSSAAYQAALEGIRRLTAPSRRIASVCREEVRSKPCPHTLLLCCNALCLTGLHTRGIFKDAPLPGAQPAADQLAAQLEAGAVLLPVNLDPVTAAACIKLFLVSLDDPLMTHRLLDRWVNAGHSLAAGTLTPQEVEQLLAALPLANRVSAALIIQTCYRIASQFDKTGMNALALAQELGPLLLWRVSSGQEALHVAAAAAANTPAWAGASLVAGIQALRAKVGAHPAATTPSGPADPSGTSPTISHPPHQAQAQTPQPAMGLPVSTALGGGGGGDSKWAGGSVQAGLDDVGGEELEELDVGQGPTEGQLAPGPAPGGSSADVASRAGGGVKEGLVGAEKEAWLRVVEFLILNAEELFPAPHWL
ncbi:Rho GTPase activation protein [Haematococcus lacustris]